MPAHCLKIARPCSNPSFTNKVTESFQACLVPDPARKERAEVFETTQWSVVMRAANVEDIGAQKALESVCRACWYPIYAFVRRQGYTPEDAQDLTQGFFVHVLEANILSHADKNRGRFRSFLLGSLRHFISNEARRFRAEKRGGGATFVSIDDKDAEERLGFELPDSDGPEELFRRNWAENLLSRACEILRSDYERSHKLHLYHAISPYLLGSASPDSYHEVARSLGITAGSLAVMVFRMRKRYGVILRQEIAKTVDDPADVQSEIRLLMEAVAS